MEIKASAKYLRISPKKVRLVVDVIRKMGVNKAENQLRFVPRRSSGLILKLLNSAIANAEHNFNLKRDNLYIKKILVNEGPALKRWMPKAMGRATPIKKRSSHIEIILAEYKPTAKVEKINPAEAKKDREEVIMNEAAELKGEGKIKKTGAERKQKIKAKQAGVKSKIFSRKAI